MKKNRKLIGAGVLTAIASSLCCIVPVLALVSGATGVAARFSWLEPFRPYLVGVTILFLGFAWYQILKPKKANDCECEEDEKSRFLRSKLFLVSITLFVALMTAFPYYSFVFYPNSAKEAVAVDKAAIEQVSFNVKGMTCVSCEEHINYTVNLLEGVIDVKTSYEQGITKIEFDKTKLTIAAIEKIINATGYTVVNIK